MTILTQKGVGGFRLEISDEVESGRYCNVRLYSLMGEATKKVYSLDFDQLVSQLEEMARSLSGAAKMQSLEGDFQIRLEMQDSLGHVRIETTLIDHYIDSEFRAAGGIDQTYLPTFITNLKKLDLSGDRGDS